MQEQTRSETTFARRLKEFRQQSRMSQAVLAQRLSEEHGIDLDPTAITRMEKADHPRAIRLNEATAIAAVLGVRLVDMLSAAQAGEAAVEQAKRAWTEAEVEVARLRGQIKDAEAAVAVTKERYRRLKKDLDRTRQHREGGDDG